MSQEAIPMPPPFGAEEQEYSPQPEHQLEQQQQDEQESQSTPRRVGRPKKQRRYTHCQRCMKELTAKTHLRSGPTGPGTLCGSCGQKWLRDKKRGIDNSDLPAVRDMGWMTRMITMQQDLIDQQRRDAKEIHAELRRLDREITKLKSLGKGSPAVDSSSVSSELSSSASSSYSSSEKEQDEEEEEEQPVSRGRKVH